MWDFLRERGSSAEDKRREAMSAYLDNALAAADRERFERQIAADVSLRDDLERMRLLKLQMRAMPRRRVPRSFALDPALYGRPKAQPLMQLYPVLRGATALTAFLLIFTLALGVFRGQSLMGGEPMTSAVEVSMEESAPEEPAAAASVAEEAQFVAPESADSEQRVRPTDSVAEAPAAELAQDEITGTFSVEALPPQATQLPDENLTETAIPESDLALEAGELAEEATVEEFEEQADAVVNEVAGTPGETAVDEATTEAAGGFSSLLRPIQIGLGIAFITLFILWLIARSRMRSL